MNASIEMIGDRWSLLIVRDLMLRGMSRYQQFLGSGEGIATNVLADRLRKLECCGIIAASPDPADRRKLTYRLTAKGIDLAPVLVELVLWAARHEATEAPPALLQKMKRNRAGLLAEIRKNWEAEQ